MGAVRINQEYAQPGGNGTTYTTTATFSFTVGRIYVAWVLLSRATVGITTPGTLTGGGTWTHRGTNQNTNTRTLACYTMVASATATVPVTYTVVGGSDNFNNFGIVVEERLSTEVDVLAPFVKYTSAASESGTTTTTTFTMTSGNLLHHGASTYGSGATVSSVSWTQLTPAPGGGGDNRLASQYKDTDDTSAVVTWSGTALTLGAVLELKAAPILPFGHPAAFNDGGHPIIMSPSDGRPMLLSR